MPLGMTATVCYIITNIDKSNAGNYIPWPVLYYNRPWYVNQFNSVVLVLKGRWLSSHIFIEGKFTSLHCASVLILHKACSTICSAVPNSPWWATYSSFTWNRNNNQHTAYEYMCLIWEHVNVNIKWENKFFHLPTDAQ